jgi:hypothetical protein
MCSWGLALALKGPLMQKKSLLGNATLIPHPEKSTSEAAGLCKQSLQILEEKLLKSIPNTS